MDMDMETDKSHFTEHRALYPRHGTNNKLLTVAVIISVLLSVIAIIVVLVNVGKTSPTNINVSGPANIGSSGIDDDKIWLLAFEDGGFNYGYIHDETGELRGFNIDVANAVCKIANKNCQTVYDTPQRCWDSRAGSRAHAGEGIMTGYYDACVGWAHTYDRHRTLRFSDPYLRKPSSIGFLTLARNAGSFDWLNLTGKTIGFVDGSLADEHCVARVDRIQGKDLAQHQIRHYADSKSLYKALDNGEIDATLWYRSDIGADYSVVSDFISECTIAGLSVMTRKDNRLIDWWNPAFEKLKYSSQWPDICNDLTEKHGHVGGPDAKVCIS